MTDPSKLADALDDALHHLQCDPTIDSGLVAEALRAASDFIRAQSWRKIEEASRTAWLEFEALQDGEIYRCRYDDRGRIAFRTHSLFSPKTHRVIDAVLDGKKVKANVLIEEGPEVFEHLWTLWTRGFEFAPTHFRLLPDPPEQEQKP